MDAYSCLQLFLLSVVLLLYEGCSIKVLGCLLLGITPFPLVVFAQQVNSLFMPDSAQMELLSSIFLFGEGALEASPQLLLLLYIIVSDCERDIPWIHWLYQVPGGYGPAPAGYTTTSRYRAALAAKNERGTYVKIFKNCATLGYCAHSRDSDIKTLF